MRWALLSASVLAAACPGAQAQPPQPQTQGTITYTLDYEVYRPTGPAGGWNQAEWVGGAGTPVSPGEGAVLRLWMSMSGTPGGLDPQTGVPAGTPLTWNPNPVPPGWPLGSGAGGLAGFWSGDVSVEGDGGAPSALGLWSNDSSAFAPEVRRRLTVFTAGGGHGLVNGSPTGAAPASGVAGIRPAQFHHDAGALDRSGGVVVWTGLWIPTISSDRVVRFAATTGPSGALSRVAAMDNWYPSGWPWPVDLGVETRFGPPVMVQVVPGPGAGVALGLVATLALRARRPAGPVSSRAPRSGGGQS